MIVLALGALAAACGDRSEKGTSDAATPAISRWQVTETTFGPVHFGMTLDEANAVFAGRLEPEEPLDSACDYVDPRGLSQGVSFMVVGGQVVRVDVRDSSVSTAEGARVGDSEDRVRSLYKDRLEVEPHKYVKNGHYLVVGARAESDSTHFIVFETDGRRVTEYRAGRTPEVDWVEGCS